MIVKFWHQNVKFKLQWIKLRFSEILSLSQPHVVESKCKFKIIGIIFPNNKLLSFQYFITNLCELRPDMNESCKIVYNNSTNGTVSSIHNSIRCSCSNQHSAFVSHRSISDGKENKNPVRYLNIINIYDKHFSTVLLISVPLISTEVEARLQRKNTQQNQFI